MLFPRARHLLLTVDTAIADEDELRRHVEQRLGVEVRKLSVQQLDFVRDITLVDVRCRRSREVRVPQPQPRPATARVEEAIGDDRLVNAGGSNGTRVHAPALEVFPAAGAANEPAQR
jgi:hypothetical protein